MLVSTTSYTGSFRKASTLYWLLPTPTQWIYVADKNGNPFAVQVKTKANATLWHREAMEHPVVCS